MDMVNVPPPKSVVGQGVVTAHQKVAADTFLMTINCPAVAQRAGPGLFVKLRAWEAAEEGGTPLLDRPFCLHDTQGETISILYRVVGRGTAALSRAAAGSVIKVSGPLGRGLADCLDKPRPLYLAAGGLGLAPMRLAAGWAAGSKLFYGERSGRFQAEESWLKSWAEDFEAVTEEGDGYGGKGLATAPLHQALEREVRPIFACGPNPMLGAVSALGQKYGAPVWVSVEAGMACGFGVCLTCSLPLKDGGRFRVCREGPVVDGRLVDWEKVKR